MKNFKKYKTAEERTKAFERLCTLLTDCEKCPCYKQKGYPKCEFIWLDLEAKEEKPLPCPFCGHKCRVIDDEVIRTGVHYKRVECTMCEYHAINEDTIAEAIATHNRVAKAAMDAKAKEEEK